MKLELLTYSPEYVAADAVHVFDRADSTLYPFGIRVIDDSDPEFVGHEDFRFYSEEQARRFAADIRSGVMNTQKQSYEWWMQMDEKRQTTNA